jgi:hypothetical protein
LARRHEIGTKRDGGFVVAQGLRAKAEFQISARSIGVNFRVIGVDVESGRVMADGGIDFPAGSGAGPDYYGLEACRRERLE